MANFRNALESPVVKAAERELQELATDPQVPNLVEVVAYTLNRLPPKYATTHRGWMRHREAVNQTMQLQISETIGRGVQVLRMGDPLHDSKPIPEQEFQCKSLTLLKLQTLLENTSLEWRDIPGALSRKLAQIEGKSYQFATVPNLKDYAKYNEISPSNRQAVSSLVGYINRRKAKNWANSADPLPVPNPERPKPSSRLIFDLDLNDRQDLMKVYTLKASLGFSNVLENLVLSAANAVMQQVDTELRSQINLSEAAAYALNRLPPMYATSERGWQMLRRKAKEELSREILLQVKAAFSQVLNRPKREPQPLPFQKFDLEYDDALLQLKMILQREDLTWLNIVELTEQAIAKAATYSS